MISNLFAQINHAFPWWVVFASYLLGSIPTSYVVGKLFFGTDIRKTGSGNSGATNVLRTFGAKAGIIVLIIDILKGVAAIYLAKLMTDYVTTASALNWIIAFCGISVVVGHVFTVFLGFKGGKGVATAGGVFLALSPLTVLFCLVLFGIVVFTTKYVSVGSMLTAGAFLFIELITQIIMKFNNAPKLLLVAVVVGLIILKHKANLQRLHAGNENKISFRSHLQGK